MMLCGEETGELTGPTRRTAPIDCHPGVRVFHLVLFLIRLLDERSGDLVKLPQRRYDPDRLGAALLGGLWGGVQLRTCG